MRFRVECGQEEGEGESVCMKGLERWGVLSQDGQRESVTEVEFNTDVS